MNDPVAGFLDQITKSVQDGMRPPPSTIWALRRLNGALGKLASDQDLTPDAFEKELGFHVQHVPPDEHA